MKIGIVTFWSSKDNYGQQLQLLALQKFLTQQGFFPFLIRFDPASRTLFQKIRENVGQFQTYVKLFRRLFSAFRGEFSSSGKHVVDREFIVFQENNINFTERVYRNWSELKADPPAADVYIAGSDQIWTVDRYFNGAQSYQNVFYLNFGDQKIKRISYAASLQAFELYSSKQSAFKKWKPLIDNFSLVTLREQTNVEKFKALGIDAHWAVDPTLLLDSDFYSSFFEPIALPEKFCLVYLIGVKTDCTVEEIESFAYSRNLKVVYVVSQGNVDVLPTKRIFPTIGQFLSCIANAECIITNSYHGMLFANIFKKRFAVIPLKSFPQRNVRVESFLNHFNALGHIYNGSLETSLEIPNSIDYSTEVIRSSSLLLNALRERGPEFVQ